MNVEQSSTGAAYIRYTTSPSVDNVYVGEDETADVLVDVDEHGGVDVTRARDFAVEHGLPFPRDLAAAALTHPQRDSAATAFDATALVQACDDVYAVALGRFHKVDAIRPVVGGRTVFGVYARQVRDTTTG